MLRNRFEGENFKWKAGSGTLFGMSSGHAYHKRLGSFTLQSLASRDRSHQRRGRHIARKSCAIREGSMVTADRTCLQPICATLQRFSPSIQHSNVNAYSLRGAGKSVVLRGKGKGAHLHSRKLVYIKLSRPQKTKLSCH